MSADTRVIAFARTWSLDALDATAVQAILERVRSLGTELVVLSRGGVWTFRPDDLTVGRHTDKLAGDVSTALALYTSRPSDDSIYVIADGVVRRVGQGAASLLDALDAAAELLVRRRLRQVSPAAASNSNHPLPPSMWCREDSLVALRS